jgi:hypothetical protein
MNSRIAEATLIFRHEVLAAENLQSEEDDGDFARDWGESIPAAAPPARYTSRQFGDSAEGAPTDPKGFLGRRDPMHGQQRR